MESEFVFMIKVPPLLCAFHPAIINYHDKEVNEKRKDKVKLNSPV